MCLSVLCEARAHFCLPAQPANRLAMSAFPPKADMCSATAMSGADISIGPSSGVDILLIYAASPGANMSQSQIDLEAFRNFEKTTHDKLAESYHDAFSAVTNRAIEPLLKAVDVGNGT